MTDKIDPQEFRVNLICACQNDIAYGFGATLLDARTIAESEFKKAHGAKAKYTQIVVERVTDDGSHYEVHSTGLHYEFTPGLGWELSGRDLLVDRLVQREHSTHPFVFESSDPYQAEALRDMLQLVVNGSRVNVKLRATAQRALDDVKKLAQVIW
jgi:hypothetical protein